MPIQLPFAEYCFSFTALEPLTMPVYSGTLWHAVLGKALHERSCLVPNTPSCHHCLLASECDYPLLFQGKKPPNSAIMTRYKNIPAPHIIRNLPPHAYQVERQQVFHIDLILLGKSNQKLPALIAAMQKIGRNGFGRDRQKAVLTQVLQKQPFAALDSIILMDDVPLRSGKAIDYMIPKSEHIPTKISLQWCTPYRPTGDARNSRVFQLDKLVMAVIRRISALQYFNTGQQLAVDYRELKRLTQRLVISKNSLYRRYHKQLAKRKNQHKQGYGWMGRVDMDLSQQQPLWDYLYLGQWLGVGKNASMGFGQYKLIAMD